MGQSRGWFASKNSMMPSRAFIASGELVMTFMPGCTGHAQEATGLGDLSTSTRHIRQLPAIRSFLPDFSSGAKGGGLSMDRNSLMVAVSWYCDASLLTCRDYGRARFN